MNEVHYEDVGLLKSSKTSKFLPFPYFHSKLMTG